MGLPVVVAATRRAGVALPAELLFQARTLVATTWEKGCQVLGMPLPMPSCSFDLRGTCAGQAITRTRGGLTTQRVVRLNAQLVLDHGMKFLLDTVPHEIAHLLVHARHGARCKPHGREWVGMMRALGAEPSRTHSLEVTPARRVPACFRYRCSCTEYMLTNIRHKRAQDAGTGYRCKKCKQSLRFCGTTPPEKAALPLPFDATPRPTPRASTAPPAPPGPAPDVRPHPVVLAPTERQLVYADALATRRRTVIPPSARYDRVALSEWISRHA